MTTLFCGSVQVAERRNRLAARRRAPDGPGQAERVLSDGRASLAWSQDMAGHDGPRTTLALFGYLTNRAELDQRFPLPELPPDATPATHIAALHETYGAAALHALEGPFSLALWDAAAQKMILARDPFGGRPLYYHRHGGRLVFATSVRGLTNTFDVPFRPNLDRLAQMCLDHDAKLDTAKTFFEGIHSVPPATLMILSQTGITQERTWTPGEDAVDVPKGDAFWEVLRAHIYRIVDNHLPDNGPAFAMLSGGLDSSSMVAVAAERLAARGEVLTTLSAVPEAAAPGQLSETDFIAHFKDKPNINQQFISAPGCGPLDDIDAIVARAELPVAMPNHFLYGAMSDHVAQAGGHSLLDGIAGELGPTAHATSYFTEMLRRGRWGLAWREARLMSARYDMPLASILKSKVARPILKRRLGARSWDHIRPIVQPAFLDGHGVSYSTSGLASRAGAFDQRAVQLFLLQRAPKTSFPPTGPLLGDIEYRYPFRDRALVEFCLNAPTELKLHDGYDRYLIRRALDGVLPKPIQTRVTKAPFCVDYDLRYNRQRTVIQDRLDAVDRKSPLREVVNVEALERLAQTEMTFSKGDRPENTAGRHIIPAGLFLLAFLRQFPEFQ